MTKGRRKCNYTVFPEPIPFYRYEKDGWQPVSRVNSQHSFQCLDKHQTLHIFNYNVLFDLYQSEKIYTDQRIPHILRLLGDSDADIITLQEVTPSFLSILCQQDWVRQKYYISDVSGDETLTQDGYGQAFLCKFKPNALFIYHFSPIKRVLLPLFYINTGNRKEKLVIPVVHLSSDSQQDCSEKRIQQMKWLFTQIDQLGADHAIIIGDFNFTDGYREEEILAKWGKDAWLELYSISENPGYTFNPLKNLCAAKTSNPNRMFGRRLDRIVLRSRNFVTKTINLAGTETITVIDPTSEQLVELHPSDHFALESTLSFQERTDRSIYHNPRKRVTTALVIIPPRDLWPPLEEIRRKHLSNSRMGPHITLATPFVSYYTEFADVKQALTEALRNFQPFEITLEKWTSYQKEKSFFLHLIPDSCGYLLDLHGAIMAVYPEFNDLARSSYKNEYEPIMSMAMFKDPGNHNRFLWEYTKSWKTLKFSVEEIYLVSRVNKDPLEVRAVVPLGGPCAESNDPEFMPVPE